MLCKCHEYTNEYNYLGINLKHIISVKCRVWDWAHSTTSNCIYYLRVFVSWAFTFVHGPSKNRGWPGRIWEQGPFGSPWNHTSWTAVSEVCKTGPELQTAGLQGGEFRTDTLLSPVTHSFNLPYRDLSSSCSGPQVMKISGRDSPGRGLLTSNRMAENRQKSPKSTL